MFRAKRSPGFSLIELLLVLAILGIISAIAIPQFLGQRRRARVIGDALSNAKVISMLMEQFRADATNYGPVTGTASWIWGPAATYNTPVLAGYTANPCPLFKPAGNSQMNFVVRVGTTVDLATGGITANGNNQTYTISISESTDPAATVFAIVNESHGVWKNRNY